MEARAVRTGEFGEQLSLNSVPGLSLSRRLIKRGEATFVCTFFLKNVFLIIGEILHTDFDNGCINLHPYQQ